MIQPKNKPLKTPLEPPRKQGTKNPATMGGELMGRETAAQSAGRPDAPGRKKPPPDNQGRG